MARPSIVHEAFTVTDRRRLARALSRATAAREDRRVAAVLAIAEGQDIPAVARQARVDRTTVHRHDRPPLGRALSCHARSPGFGRRAADRPAPPPRTQCTQCMQCPTARADTRAGPVHAGLSDHHVHGGTLGRLLCRAVSLRRQPAHAAPAPARAGLPLETAALPRQQPGDASGAENGALRRRLRAAVGPRDVVLFTDWTLLRFFPPLRGAWAPVGTAGAVLITGENAKAVLFGAIHRRAGHRVLRWW